MDLFIVCANDIDEQYGCYIDSVWNNKKKAEKRREELNSEDQYSYDEPWYIENYVLNEEVER